LAAEIDLSRPPRHQGYHGRTANQSVSATLPLVRPIQHGLGGFVTGTSTAMEKSPGIAAGARTRQYDEKILTNEAVS
jgi:hypothetical protein